ncbi:MAG: hypothetical protein RRC34_07700 [Lentisphaeria bacterium]|nr:hypothetical protein [Lentisphaeria bacterium]
MAQPQLDFPIGDFEKNWMYAALGQKLWLFYSVNPYRVLRLKNDGEFQFQTVINTDEFEKLKDPGGFGTRVSLSANPIDYDDKHLLLIIHQIQHRVTGRCYFHWAVLIDKKTLLPVKISSKPIFDGKGARGRTPGIRYISSILKDTDDIVFFAGEGDVYCTLARKTISGLDMLWEKI